VWAPPQAGGQNPTIYADFAGNNYWAAGAVKSGFAAWMTAIGATYSRASSATYIDGGIVKTAAANVPRLYGNGIRLTGSATNLVTQSQTLSSWAKVGGATASTGQLAPDGISTVFQFTEDTSNGQHYAISPLVSETSGQAYTMSVFAKAGARTRFVLYSPLDGVGYGFDLSNGTTFDAALTAPTSLSMTPLSNGWYLCSITFTATATSNGNLLLFLVSGTSTSYVGDGVSNIYYWGGQATATAFQADYIPTTTATVTQAADSFQFPFTQTTFSVLAGINGHAAVSARIVGTDNSDASIYNAGPVSAQIGTYDSSALLLMPVADIFAANKAMAAGSPSGRSFTHNGLTPISDANPMVFGAGVSMAIGSQAGTSGFSYGNYSQFGVWNGIVASDADLIRLTGGTPPNLPMVGGKFPSIYADFTGTNYWASGAQANFSAWLTALGGTYSRASSATYLQGGVVKTAAANVARFPTDLGGVPTGIRLTGPATNITLASQGDLGPNWLPVNASLALNAAAAADGTNTAVRLTEDATNGGHFVELTTGAPVTATVYTLSVFAKANTRTQFILDALNVASAGQGFDLAAGTMFATGAPFAPPISASMTPLANGWYLCSMSFNAGSSGAGNVGAVYMTVGGSYQYQGDGASGIYLWGAQLTQTAFPVDYIPTTTATVTQAADVLSVPTSGWLSTVGSTLASSGFAAVAPGGATQVALAFNSSGGTFGPAGAAALLRLGAGDVGLYEIGGAGTSASVVSISNANYKVAGVLNVPTTLQRVVTPSVSNENSTLDFTGVGTARLPIGALDAAGTQHFYGDMKSMGYWPVAASVAQAQTMLGQLP
jgi:hypothetical protein